MRGNSWNEDGYVYTIIDDDTPSEAQQLLQPLMGHFQPSNDQDIELEIQFNSNGYYDPGSTYGDDAYPPEGDDERTLVGMTLYGPGIDPKGIKIPPQIAQQLFQIYYSEIEAADLEDNGGDNNEDEAYDRMRDARFESKIIGDVSRLITEDPDVFDR